MAEIILNRPNWLGSEVGKEVHTTTITEDSGTVVTENGRKIIKSGTLITDANLGQGLLYNDADVTDGGVVKSIMIRGSYIDAKLPDQSQEVQKLLQNKDYMQSNMLTQLLHTGGLMDNGRFS